VAHMMTGRELDGTTIGIAFLGSVCNRSRAYGLSQSHFTTNMGYRITLTAHELGHSWNANHCDAAIPCYIMCSNVGSCDGAGLPGFEPMAIDAITSFAASRSCFGAPVAVEEYAPDGSVRFAPPTPSPFTGETRLGFYLERDQWVALDVYDVRGNRVARLVEGRQPAGWHQVAWRGRDQSGHPVRAGVYFTRLEMVGSMVSHKLILLH